MLCQFCWCFAKILTQSYAWGNEKPFNNKEMFFVIVNLSFPFLFQCRRKPKSGHSIFNTIKYCTHSIRIISRAKTQWKRSFATNCIEFIRPLCAYDKTAKNQTVRLKFTAVHSINFTTQRTTADWNTIIVPIEILYLLSNQSYGKWSVQFNWGLTTIVHYIMNHSIIMCVFFFLFTCLVFCQRCN